MNDVLVIALYVAIAVLGIASTVVASIWTWRFLRRRNMEALPAALIVVLAAILAFWGLWLVFGIVWIAIAVVKLMMRVAGGQGRAAAQGS